MAPLWVLLSCSGFVESVVAMLALLWFCWLFLLRFWLWDVVGFFGGLGYSVGDFLVLLSLFFASVFVFDGSDEALLVLLVLLWFCELFYGFSRLS
jgi:hypothetical protein